MLNAPDDIFATPVPFGGPIGVNWLATQYREPGARTNWAHYGVCKTCHALAGFPCTDTTVTHLRFLACAHEHRSPRGSHETQMMRDVAAATGDHTMHGEYENVR